MNYRKLGRWGVRVSPLCVGTGGFGIHTSEADAHAILDIALDSSINFIDTANVYGSRPGESEEIIGSWIKQGGERRDHTVIATKVRVSMQDWPNRGGLSSLHIQKSCEESLRRLGTDRIDLLQLHATDPEVPFEEFLQAIEILIRQGKVVYAGTSNFAGFQISRINQMCLDRNLIGFISEQCRYNLLSRMVELEVVPACLDSGVGIIPWSPRQGGLLSGGISEAKEGRRASEDFKQKAKRIADKLQTFEKLCANINARMGDVAVAWLLTRPAVSSAIIGPRTPEQMRQSLDILDIELSKETLDELDRIFPGPPQPAPDAYLYHQIG